LILQAIIRFNFGPTNFNNVKKLYGPHQVGFKEIFSDNGNAISVFYPADDQIIKTTTYWLLSYREKHRYLRNLMQARKWMAQGIDPNRPSAVKKLCGDDGHSFWDFTWLIYFMSTVKIDVIRDAKLS
jgi:hypothetical protein